MYYNYTNKTQIKTVIVVVTTTTTTTTTIIIIIIIINQCSYTARNMYLMSQQS